MSLIESISFNWRGIFIFSTPSIRVYMYKRKTSLLQRTGRGQKANIRAKALPSIPHSRDLRMPHLLLKLKDAVHQRLAGRRTAWNVDIHRHDSVTTPSHRVTVMIISTAVRTASHANHPSWVRHLVVHLPQCRCHFVCECSRDDHHV